MAISVVKKYKVDGFGSVYSWSQDYAEQYLTLVYSLYLANQESFPPPRYRNNSCILIRAVVQFK